MIKFKNYLGERVDTTQNASVTELFPALAFNMNFKPRSCLLYTSPSPRDRQKSRMPSSA